MLSKNNQTLYANNQAKLPCFGLIISLSCLFFFTQIIFFCIHYQVTDVVDSLVNQTISLNWLHISVILPVINYICISILAYFFFVSAIYFISQAFTYLFNFSNSIAYFIGLFYWLTGHLALFSLNNYFFPYSFFANWISSYSWLQLISVLLAKSTPYILGCSLLIAFYHFFCTRKAYSLVLSLIAYSLFVVSSLMVIFFIYHQIEDVFTVKARDHSYPNIIIIGLDSVRLDHISYLDKQFVKTPEIDAFLKNSMFFSQSYTPLARTFPSWMSILTGQYPIHHMARANLTNAKKLIQQVNLSKILQQAGYETFYATDEKRFSNITQDYGFNHVIGPPISVNDFLLGSLNDFPLNNLLIHSPLGKWLFPYQYSNRAAYLTYYPEDFLSMVKTALKKRDNQRPLFLAIHLCITHWPFIWANTPQTNVSLAFQYKKSVEEIDQQFGHLLKILTKQNLLNHTVVVLLSDHGTTLGLPHDRVISQEQYQGNRKNLKLISLSRLSADSLKNDGVNFSLVMHTSYGQGSDLLSLKQNHALLAFKGYGLTFKQGIINQTSSLIDIAPTLLHFLHLPVPKMDGMSLLPYLYDTRAHLISRPIFMETADKLVEIETDKINTLKVLKKKIFAYEINPKNGLLSLNKEAELSIIRNKQHAILFNHWLLAHYPSEVRTKLITSINQTVTFVNYFTEPYWVLVNLQSKHWTLDFKSPLARQAPLANLQDKLIKFYGKEIPRFPSDK